jgi:excinuclease UvrABC ATPase subunit
MDETIANPLSALHSKGVIRNLERRYRETGSDYIRNKISEYMSDRPCPNCSGTRLRPEVLAVTIDGNNIIEITDWPVLRTLTVGAAPNEGKGSFDLPAGSDLFPHPERN